MMTSPDDPRHVHLHGPEAAAPPPDEFDPANAELANALRKSFRVLKVIMFVLIILYFVSGFFSVKPGEQGLVLRFGEIVGAREGDAIRKPGWHWSLPFPIDQWLTVKVEERELELFFTLKLSPEEEATGKIQQKFNNLSPERDDYLVTGDVNILHATILLKYKIENIVDYVTNVLPAPSPHYELRSKPYEGFPEYTLLRNLARDAVISTAARYGALEIRGNQQKEFLLAVGAKLNERLKQFDDAGKPLGIFVDPNTGVIAPKSKTGSLEAIMPPRQTQEVFDQVFSAQTNRVVAITKARSEAETLLVSTVGPDYQELADSIEQEYELIRRLSSLEDGTVSTATGTADSSETVESLRQSLAKQRERTEALLQSASGEIRSIVKDAEIERDRVIQEAIGDYNRLISVLPEYRRNPQIFLSRLLDETRGRALMGKDVVKVYVPEDALQYRLQIPRAGGKLQTPDQIAKQKEKERRDNLGTIPQPEIRRR